MKDDKYAVVHDYSRRAVGVVYAEIFAPDNAPAFASDREALWNAVEKSERRKDSQLARELIIALPHELSAEQRREAVVGFVKDELVSRGMIADVTIHEPEIGDNVHSHVLFTMRTIGPEGFGKKERSWNDDALLKEWRISWETHCNAALEGAGLDVRVDQRSLADQGIDREPQPKLGGAAAAMERKGFETQRGLLVNWNKFENRIRSAVRSIQDSGEVTQHGIGSTWWERAQAAVSYGVDAVREMMQDESSGNRWQVYESKRQQEPERDAPDMEFG